MIYLTGATGFIGLRVAQLLQQKKQTFICLLRPESHTDRLDLAEIKYLKGDFGDAGWLAGVFKKGDMLIHLAGVTHASRRSAYIQGNIGLTKSIVDAGLQAGLKKIIFLSTAVVNSLGDYARTKKEAENIIISGNINYVIIRSALVYGPGDRKNLTALIKLVGKTPLVPVIGNGKNRLQPIYVNDLAEILVQSIGAGHNREIVGAAGPDSLTYDNLLMMIASLLGKKIILVHIPLKIAKIIIRVYCLLVKNSPYTIEQVDRAQEDKLSRLTRLHRKYNLKMTSLSTGLKACLSPSRS